MLLSNNERFLNEYQEFKNKINQVNNEKIKEELQSLLNKLLTEVKIIDQQHADLKIYSKNPSELTDHRSSVLSLRKKISKKLEECQKAGLI